ncbi:MAG: DUF4331 family protein [Gemmatimonadaceae bacterium]
MKSPFHGRGRPYSILLAAGIAVSVAGIGTLLASDHQDTPEVELNPRMDINDVYAFPGSTSDRVALVLTTSSPLAGTNASFDPNLLYQIKIDNTGDAKEDLVFQVTFDQGALTNQKVSVRGPVAPATVGTATTLVTTGTVTTGNVGSTLGSATGIQVYTGVRGDPFFIDLEQFFKILPDRRPSTGPLSVPSTATASMFRSPGVDLLAPFNCLAIVIEVPKSMLTSSTATDAKVGVWATISR